MEKKDNVSFSVWLNLADFNFNPQHNLHKSRLHIQYFAGRARSDEDAELGFDLMLEMDILQGIVNFIRGLSSYRYLRL